MAMPNARFIQSVTGRLIAVAAAALTVLGAQLPAQAAPPQRDSGSLTDPTGHGSGEYTVDYDANTLSVQVSAGSLPANNCVTVYLDIRRTAGSGHEGAHYDIRAARTCQSNSTRGSGLQLEGAWYGTDIVGINKLSICYGVLNTMGDCRHYIGALQGVDPSFNSNKMCSRSWTKNSSGTDFYFSGGKSWDCGD